MSALFRIVQDEYPQFPPDISHVQISNLKIDRIDTQRLFNSMLSKGSKFKDKCCKIDSSSMDSRNYKTTCIKYIKLFDI